MFDITQHFTVIALMAFILVLSPRTCVLLVLCIYLPSRPSNAREHPALNMFSLLFLALAASASHHAIMDTEMTPDNGPEMDTVYVPGTPGADWTSEEVETTRQRIFQIMTPVWDEKEELGLAGAGGRNENNFPGQLSENIILRLVFHDCIPYADGSGGCDGCLNFNHMDSVIPNPNDDTHWYAFTPANATDNRGLDGAAIALEKIYTTLDWPFQNPSLDVSLYQSGKSRADLWQFAGLVALELGLERANRACDLDYHARQQVKNYNMLQQR